MHLFQMEQVCKAYGAKMAVDNLSLTLEAGEIFGLLGPNGAGKTSTLRMMMGMTLPDSGSIRIFDQPFARTSLRRVGYLPEERGLYKKMRVLDQLVLLGQLRGLETQEARKRALHWMERLEITEALPKKAGELSKGMQQKIQFIATVLHEPDLLLLDEPFSGLDPVNALLLQDVLLEMQKQGKAILFSTHRMDQVERLCESICLMHKGRAVLAGRLREIKERFPHNRLRVEFSGSAEFLSHDGIASFTNDHGRAEITLRSDADAQQILTAAMAGARISHFSVQEPTLEEIFIATVGGKSNA